MPTSTSPKALSHRYAELDSIRGVAALTVVFHHAKQMWIRPHELTGWHKLLMEAVNPLATGHEAVLLFFVLSGFVLSVPYLAGKGESYPVFLVRRILRIYCPYFFALALAVVGATVWHQPIPGNVWADMTWSEPVRAKLILQHVLFLGNYDWSQFNTAFWSLVLEMRISIVFPFLFALVIALRLRSAAIVAALLSIVASLVTYWNPGLAGWTLTLQVAAIFILGILLARNVARISSWYSGLGTTGRVLLVICSFSLYAWGHDVTKYVNKVWGVELWLVTFGAVGYVVLGLNSPFFRRVLNSTAPRFLGRISYSLYLVHGTVLFALVHALRGRASVIAQFLIYLVVSILLATVFCITIEEPFMRLGRRVSRWSRNRGTPTLPLASDRVKVEN